MSSILDTWRRRRWQRDDAALQAFAGMQPATVITGGSEGIGLAFAGALARHRAAIVLVARSERALAQARDGLSGASARIMTLALDITDAGAADLLTAQLREQGYFIDELVNNAGIGLSGRFAELPPEDIDRLMALNIAAATRLQRTVLPDMLVRGRGGIINVASLGGLTPGPYQAAYYASKAYLISLSRAVAHETRGMGVRITCVAPGPVETRFHARMNAERAFYRRFLPALSPAHVANATLFWYAIGCRLVIPGVMNTALALALKLLPGAITIPVVALLLNPGEDERDV